jgi:hypothetical protein
MVPSVLSSFDDYPIHQGSLPIALTATSDPNHYDRYFFNGYTRTGDLFFAAAMGLYPNRHVADAAFSVVRGGQQVNVHASRRAPADRRDANAVGPITVEIVEPLRTLRLIVEAPEHGLRADLTFRHRTTPIEEPHFFRRTGNRVWFDYTRLTQFGTWEGWVEVDGERVEVSPAEVVGTRDRSWGVRPVGERYAYGAPVAPPQFFWLWAPVNFDGFCAHFDVNETSSGEGWHQEAVVVPLGDAPATGMTAPHYRIDWAPGTRHAARFEVDLVDDGGAVSTMTLEPFLHFQMSGLGYTHPEWGHGVWKGENEVGGDRWALPIPEPVPLDHLHIQALSRATFRHADGREDHGIGILEQFVLGPHEPTGLTGIIDSFAG